MDNKNDTVTKENKQIVYIAELDQDVDDVIAAEYLHSKNVLKCIVCDPRPSSKEGIDREKSLRALGIEVRYKMPPVAKYVFVGGALTLVSEYIKMHSIDTLVMNGGFAGTNVVNSTNELNKFKGKKYVRTFNFNCDVKATDSVLRSSKRQIGSIMLIGKNVCHDERNTPMGIWSDDEYKEIFDKYRVKPAKLQHDMLACHEGLVNLTDSDKIDVDIDNSYCKYDKLYPCTESGLAGSMTKWGSTKNTDESTYRECVVAVGYK